MFQKMACQPKILILDDERDVLEMYRELLSQIPSQPEVHTATSGARALALLNKEEFSLLLTDLNLPGMDGFQVLTIVRRKYPSLRTVVMSGESDDQYRARAYSMGIDLFLEKPTTQQEVQLFADCIESLLGLEQTTGFRGLQSKSLVDLIQLECLSKSSSVLKITNGPMEARIWVLDGDIIDATCQDSTGEDAFKKILSWRTGNFEILSADPTRERTIFADYQGLLLDSVQTIDEAQAMDHGDVNEEGTENRARAAAMPLTRIDGVEFVVNVDQGNNKSFFDWGAEEPANYAQLANDFVQSLESIGKELNLGQLQSVLGFGLQRHLILLSGEKQNLAVGVNPVKDQSEVRNLMREVQTKWES